MLLTAAGFVVYTVKELLHELTVLACAPGGTVGIAQDASASPKFQSRSRISHFI